MPACWRLELAVGPLVSRAMSRGGCGLRKSLDSLSDDGWASDEERRSMQSWAEQKTNVLTPALRP